MAFGLPGDLFDFQYPEFLEVSVSQNWGLQTHKSTQNYQKTNEVVP